MSKENSSRPFLDPVRLLVPQGVLSALGTPLSDASWAEVATAVNEAKEGADGSVSSGVVAALSILQRAGLAVLEGSPDLDGVGLASLAEELQEDGAALDGSWPRPEGVERQSLVLVIAAQLANPALKGLQAVHGTTDERRLMANKRQLAERLTPNVLKLLGAPARAFPDDLSAQVSWVLGNWSAWLPESVLRDAPRALDVYAESHRPRFDGPGPAQAPDIRGGGAGGPGGDYGDPDLAEIYGWEDGAARFSDDSDWMSDLVLVAKHTYVWLDQLTKRFGRPVNRLDEIPEEALIELATRGFRGLWLIGLWERSNASKQIKRRRGNSEAEASAYSLDDYAIAERLGGEEALKVLRERASRHGVRLAADMVPNHVGMDGRWVIDQPDLFLQVPEPPFPGYTFDGPNLSQDDRVGVYLEDGYWQETDAAVVFKWVDHHSGETRYIYHGNDGTQMPWNDTAQLDYLKPKVREVVIQTILDVARRFPVIRFDAAMTLARRHVERLWYPAPGNGGAIPSRAENSVPPEVFKELLPQEFWAEVVDRVKAEVPDTLLLAEAFWMMESYFVRTLGMHRVYNSAFMHMLRDQDNEGYRNLIKEILEYNPAILDRFVNFMNNPDEDTAVDQFGKGDKYFGVATVMATLPGLPMFGHGQFEGYAEKYGMEFAKAYWDESPDQGLLDYHAKVITPILYQRDLFSGVSDFALYDVETDGGVAEAVYAYSNRSRSGDRRSLVFYNNGFDQVSGRVRLATPVNVGSEESPVLERRTLGDALGLRGDGDIWYALRELRTGDWFLRSGRSLHEDGLSVVLDGYAAQVFMEMREIQDDDGRWSTFAGSLGGAGVQNLTESFESFWDLRDAHRYAQERGARPYPSRGAGVLIHPTSLPGPEGIGTIGAPAFELLDWMQSAGLRVWQVLPLCPGGAGRSPYSSDTSMLGNPLLIDLQRLHEQGLLTDSELSSAHSDAVDAVHFDAVEGVKIPLLQRAAERLLDSPEHPLATARVDFMTAASWLEDVLLFDQLKRENQGKPWTSWPRAQRDRDPVELDRVRATHSRAIAIAGTVAFFFDHQWSQLRQAAEERGILILGDLPIYVAHDSADVWANRAVFELTDEGFGVQVAAVPPDAFSDTGQLWGNPLYDWRFLKDSGYGWWIDRIARALEWTPLLRLDHFRGFSAYFAVDGEAKTALEGAWRQGPGLHLFNALDRALGVGPFIAEDLGIIGDDVHALRDASGMLGMRVLQFGVAEADMSLHHPSQCPNDVIVYTGTHDNDTTAGWWAHLDDEARRRAAACLGCSEDATSGCAAMIQAALNTPSLLAIFPVQDLLALGSEARMNTPGEGVGNWGWRLAQPLAAGEAAQIRRSLARSGRLTADD